MIARACYVQCDRCGSPAEVVVGDAVEARLAAVVADHFKRIKREDVCPGCLRPDERGGDE